MTTEMITLKIDNKFLVEVDRIVKEENYQNRTEFIRNALREKVDETRLKKAMIEISKLKGASKKRTSAEDFEKMRELAFKEFDKKVK